MNRIKVIGLALGAAFALSAVTSASASAHTFNSTVAGKVKVVSNTSQVFATHGFTPVEVVCKKVETVTGEAKLGKQETIESEVEYKECTLAIGVNTPLPATVSNPTYLFNANETVNNEKIVTIKAGLKCTVTVPVQKLLKTVKYANQGKDVNVEANVGGIEWSQKGTECKEEGGKAATYKGSALVEVVGGEVKWE